MLDIINRLLGRENAGSRDIARERLRLVLIHDRASVSPNFLNALKEELIRVIREYMEIDEESLIVDLENEENSVALVANIPIRGFKRAANE
ncbi:cell division topological specificity factor MinE [Syntrophomonas wolfei]|uniref:Cell division topological specificity factor 2 n=1 Tax=Syntrophomonas wolfei subsp. wolfei (strain DSM 2245B / Goettingen) TaxID=335541 RepID=MINE2_SYNWW|nr:cell division topological specificity factor MinE [Syntrophomonas wolfei]Q0AWH0.1 RecName: Full=Cell division topological specificity factor 2 [Syntrophomonas wolfei subsp. wolfei str. Goettingen G311]ABI68934.1 cell division topological specificity factor MinE [Syntrophomonas wolfei subsp. wolfei str. Goettingen G311]